MVVQNNLKIGLFGYGCVGQGLHDILNSSPGFKADIVIIAVKDKSKKRRIPMSNFTYNKEDILGDESINLIVELIDAADEAYDIVVDAMKRGKNVVTANKRMVAEHLEELVQIQQEYKVSMLYEASSCASIPIIRNLEEYYDNEMLHSVRGIFNGSTNYILSQMYNNGSDYSKVLQLAQEKGFAETDPTLDVDGYDAKFKLVIIALHAYGLFLKPEEVFNYGISKISKFDIQYAKEKGFKIKLVPTIEKVNSKTVSLFVLPRFISQDKYLYNVENEYNGIIAEAAFSDKQFFYGKGAGGHATGSAVLSDISANSYNYKYEYKKRNQGVVDNYSNDYLIEIYLRYHDKSDREKFSFVSITESFYSENFNYVIGVVNLKDLFNLQEELREMNVFIVNTGRKFPKNNLD